MASGTSAELYKDKIEVSLDGRQIFYLFFGGAVIVGLVFVLGVMVGRRVEARGHLDPARTTAAVDPLAALDKLEGSGGLSFQGALTGGEPRSDVERKIAELEKQRRAKGEIKPEPKPVTKPDKVEAKVEPKPEAKVEPKPEAKPEVKPESKPVTKPDKVEAKLEPKSDAKHVDDKKPDDKKPDDKKAEHKKSDDDKLVAKKDDDKKPDADKKKDDDKKVDADKKADTDKKLDADKKKDETKARFTLQLSSFQDKHEAEAFLASVKDAGYTPYLTEAEVSGKGTFYRVRVGSYRSMDAANDAKSELERSTRKSATVMRL